MPGCAPLHSAGVEGCPGFREVPPCPTEDEKSRPAGKCQEQGAGEGYVPSSQQSLCGRHRKPDPSYREAMIPGAHKEGISLWVLVQRTHGEQLLNHLLRKYQGKLK